MNKEEYNKLIDRLIVLAKAYYQDDESQVDDKEYDKLYNEAREYELEHPEDMREDSPTQKVGYGKRLSLEINKHPSRMYSLDNCFNDEELEAFYKRVREELGDDVEFWVTPKYDGLSLNAIYEKGKLVKALTRGDGVEGEDVTLNARFILKLPKEVEIFKDFDRVEVRGEVVMFKQVLEEVNAKLVDMGERTLSNPRNAAAGTLRQTNPKVLKERLLYFIPYDVKGTDDHDLSTALNLFIETTYKEHILRYRAVSLDDIKTHYNEILERRESLPYALDGVVIMVNSFRQQEELGYNIKAPKFGIAYKFQAIEKRTTLLNVTWQVGKSGVITPVAEITPVQIDGSKVERVTLNNSMFIYDLDLRLGDEITVIKSGDIIPKITAVHKEKRTDRYKKIPIPKVCPSCNGEVTNGGGPRLYCLNPSKCPDAIKKQIEFFFSRDCLDVDGLGENAVNGLYENAYVNGEKIELKSPLDYYKLAETKQIVEYILVGNVVRTLKLDLSKILTYGCEIWRVITGIGINGVGAKTAKKIALAIGVDYDNGTVVIDEEILDRELRKGSISRTATEAYFKDNLDEFRELILHIKPTLPEKPKFHPLNGAKICLTGSFKVTRDKIVNLLTELGVDVVNTISRRTNILFVGEHPSSKLEEARNRNIRIINLELEEDVLAYIENFKA